MSKFYFFIYICVYNVFKVIKYYVIKYYILKSYKEINFKLYLILIKLKLSIKIIV